jgi:DNA-binding transcriptional MerR regulator
MRTASRTPLRVSIVRTTVRAEARLSAEELAATAGIRPTRLRHLVEQGLLEPAEPGGNEFTAAAAERLRRMLRLRRDLGVNLVGASIIADLLRRLADLERKGKDSWISIG